MADYKYRPGPPGLYLGRETTPIPKPRCLDKHSHATYEILFFLSGDATEVIEDRRCKLKKYDLVLIRPNLYHYLQLDSDATYERYVIHFNPQAMGLNNIENLPENVEIWNCKHRPIILDLFKRIDYYYNALNDEAFLDILPFLLKELIYNLCISTDEPDSEQLQIIHPIVSSALKEINENLFTLNSINDIARKLFVTESYLYRIFKHELKTTPYRYINEKRLSVAQTLIAQGRQPTQVYRECGFNDYTTFYRAYVKRFGHPPSK